jgi:hypothetical protein
MNSYNSAVDDLLVKLTTFLSKDVLVPVLINTVNEDMKF